MKQADPAHEIKSKVLALAIITAAAVENLRPDVSPLAPERHLQPSSLSHRLRLV